MLVQPVFSKDGPRKIRDERLFPMATVDKMPMLAEGYEKLNREVRHLKTVERPAIIDAI